MIVDQFKDFMANVRFLKDILAHIQYVKNIGEVEVVGGNENAGFELHVKESFSVSFLKLILLNIIQPLLLNVDDL
jgi:hypothetical protein